MRAEEKIKKIRKELAEGKKCWVNNKGE